MIKEEKYIKIKTFLKTVERTNMLNMVRLGEAKLAFTAVDGEIYYDYFIKLK